MAGGICLGAPGFLIEARFFIQHHMPGEPHKSDVACTLQRSHCGAEVHRRLLYQVAIHRCARHLLTHQGYGSVLTLHYSYLERLCV